MNFKKKNFDVCKREEQKTLMLAINSWNNIKTPMSSLFLMNSGKSLLLLMETIIQKLLWFIFVQHSSMFLTQTLLIKIFKNGKKTKKKDKFCKCEMTR